MQGIGPAGHDNRLAPRMQLLRGRLVGSLSNFELERAAGRRAMMLSHCANSRCSRPFLRLRQGKLFLVETEFVSRSRELAAPSSPRLRLQPRRVERYWLCDECAAVWTLVHDRKQGIVLMPLSRPPVGARVGVAEEYREMA
jgi:hypothetical protein